MKQVRVLGEHYIFCCYYYYCCYCFCFFLRVKFDTSVKSQIDHKSVELYVGNREKDSQIEHEKTSWQKVCVCQYTRMDFFPRCI